MNEIDQIKKNIKNKRHNYNSKDSSKSNYVNFLITRIITAIIVFFLCLIVTNFSNKAEYFIKNEVLTDNISFAKVTKIIDKYLGFKFPIEEPIEDATVFKDKIIAESVEPYNNGYSLDVGTHFLVPIINSGIVAFIGEKEGMGPTVIIEGTDEIEYWYGGLENISVNLYDYVSASQLLGNTQSEKLYLVFKKNGEFLDYEEVME